MALHSQPLRVIAPIGPGSVTSAIAALLFAGKECARADAGEADAVVVDAFDDPAGIDVLAMNDERFEASFVEATLDRVACLQEGMARLTRPANIVVIASESYLGRWHGVAQAAASAAMVGIVRSIAVEHVAAGLRVNMLALPFDARADDASLMRDAAGQALDLLMTRSITGETILLDAGINLKFRQARRR